MVVGKRVIHGSRFQVGISLQDFINWFSPFHY
jgi:hypothetical protein